MSIILLSYFQFLFGFILFCCSVRVTPSSSTSAGPRFGGVFLADQRTDSLILLRDLDGNGNAEGEDEWNIYFTNGETGVGNPFAVHTGQSGFVYVADGDTDAVYRLEDINHDGDAQDAGEATVWFSADNAEGFTLPVPNGIWEADDGAVYILNAGTGKFPFDAVYRTVDLDGDGSANGPGEATVWLNLSTLVSELLGTYENISSAFEIVFIGNTAYITDSVGGEPDVILAAQDTNGNGQIDSGELRILLSASDNYGVDDFFSALTKIGQDLVISTFSFDPSSLWTLNNIDGNRTIDNPDQVVTVWNGENEPLDKAVSINFGIAAAQIGTNIYTASNDEIGGVFRLVDLDHDGKYDSPGEVITFRSKATDDSIPASRPRNVEVLPEFFQARGYYGVSNVDKQNDVPYDLLEINQELINQEVNMYVNILKIYEEGVPFRNTYPTLADFADGTDSNKVKSFENIFPTAVKYFGSEDFLDTWIQDAITCTGQFSDSNDDVRAAAISTGFLSLFNYWVRFELRFSKIKADDGNFSCKSGAPHNFDEAYAFYYGPRGRSALFAFLNELVKEAGNNSVTGEPYFTVHPNEMINMLFIEGVKFIAPQRPELGSDECTQSDPSIFPLYPTLEKEAIETILFKTFLVACATNSKLILNGSSDVPVTNIKALRLAVAPTINLLYPQADEDILEALDEVPVNGAKLLETFDKLIEDVNNPTPSPEAPMSPPTPSPVAEPDDDDVHPCSGAKCHNGHNIFQRNLRS